MSSFVPARSLIALASLLTMGSVATGADDGVPRVLLDRELNTTQVRLTSIDGGQVSWIDGAGRARSRSVEELLAIIDPEGGLLPESVRRQVIESLNFPLVQTTDGQRLLAQLREDPEGNPEFVELMLFGGQLMRVSIERIASVTNAESVFDDRDGAAPGAELVDDVVELANGDSVSGFVESLGASVNVEVEGVMRSVPLSDVRSIHLANPRRAGAGTRVWIDDGSVLSAGPLRRAGSGMLGFDLTLASEQDDAPEGSESELPTAMRLPLSRVAGIVFDASGAGVRPLAAMPPTSYAPTGDRRWTTPPSAGDPSPAVLGASTIELPGPMRVGWALPEGASRLAGIATLGDAPGAWADCSVSITLDAEGQRTELARARLRPGHEDLAFNVVLPPALPGESRTLEVRVDAGAYGPIQDRVLLERVLLLVERDQ